jgi:hypothetical protein
MLRQVAEGVLIHESEFCQSNAVVVHGRAGVLLIDGGIYGSEMTCLASDDTTADPIEDYLAALRLFEGVAGGVDVLVPGHGSVGGAGQVRARIDQDRAYVHALRGGGAPDDPRVGPSARPGWDWVSSVHERQLQRLARRSERDGTPG